MRRKTYWEYALSWQKNEMHFVLVSEYESEFKNILETMSNNDDEYKKLMERCNHKIVCELPPNFPNIRA